MSKKYMLINFCQFLQRIKSRSSVKILIVFGILLVTPQAFAATMTLSPSTGVYQSGATFTVNVVVNTEGQSINAAEATLRFNPNELSVVSVGRSSSIFNLWVSEPSFSNSAGTITFSGGLPPPGYSGSRGTIMSVTFRATGSGPARVTMSNGSVLANDGRGSNVLTSMGSGNYTRQAASVEPAAEVIVEYVPTANTPGIPIITSITHPNEAWSKNTTAELAWSLPAGITGVRTLLSESPTAIPTRVYEDPIRSLTLSDLNEGEQYFHIQFRNADGWGRVAHYRLAVDTAPPTSVNISQPADTDFTSPQQTFFVDATDETSGVNRLKVIHNIAEPIEVEFDPDTASPSFTLENLNPGYHTLIVEAFDQADNSFIGTYSFTILAFDRPTFTDVPEQVNEGVIPVIKGLTRPQSTVIITVDRIGVGQTDYEVTSAADGVFTFIPEGPLLSGVYELTARAVDQYGAQSESSDSVRIAVQRPGYIQVGSLIVSVLSVLIPLILLVVALVFTVVYSYRYLSVFRRRVRVESSEALEILRAEFTELQKTLRTQENLLQQSRKTQKLTKAESDMIEVFDRALQHSQQRVEKEIQDVQNLSKKHSK